MATRLVQINMKAWDDVALGEFWAEAARLRALGATDADIGQDDVPWTVLADPEGNEFCVLSPPGLTRRLEPALERLRDG